MKELRRELKSLHDWVKKFNQTDGTMDFGDQVIINASTKFYLFYPTIVVKALLFPKFEVRVIDLSWFVRHKKGIHIILFAW